MDGRWRCQKDRCRSEADGWMMLEEMLVEQGLVRRSTLGEFGNRVRTKVRVEMNWREMCWSRTEELWENE